MDMRQHDSADNFRFVLITFGKVGVLYPPDIKGFVAS